MATRVFEQIPSMTDLMPTGGRAGFEYALISGTNLIMAQDEGWDMIDRVGAFEIKGPMGSCPVVLMGKGSGIYGVATMRPRSWIDPTVCEMTGLWLPGENPAEGPEGVPTMAVVAKAAVQPVMQPKPVSSPAKSA